MDSYHQLTLDQRYQISALKETGQTQKEIAARLGVHPSTISRELRRNAVRGVYQPKAADTQAEHRRRTAKKAVRITAAVLEVVEGLIAQEWSPEQISGYLRTRRGIAISHERIYQHLRRDKSLGGDLYTYLRQGFKRRRKYGKSDLRGHLRNRVSIDKRPSVVNERARIGDWEIDTLHADPGRGGLLTVVERKSGVTRLGKLGRRQAEEVREVAISKLADVKDQVLSLTADNGKEFAEHEQISQALEADFYFAHPYSAWERGLNENTNGLVRQYFPKGTDFHEIETWEIQWVEDRLNHRPRKRLGYATPHEVFYALREAPDYT
jgi:IS30 family transposase